MAEGRQLVFAEGMLALTYLGMMAGFFLLSYGIYRCFNRCETRNPQQDLNVQKETVPNDFRYQGVESEVERETALHMSC